MSLVYYRDVTTTAKGRWYGKKLGDIQPEFGPYTEILGDPLAPIGARDLIKYRIHVHEPAIPLLPPLNQLVVHDDPQFLVINKPSGIPVHPTVNYHKHTITEQLFPKYGKLYPCYRLDRLTSGILILGKTSEFVSLFNELPKSKVYLARVAASKYPAGKSVVEAKYPIATYNAKRGYQAFLDSLSNAKHAHTIFELVDADQDLAVVKCTLITGRTHQIRKHLALLGMPIHNDTLYSSELFKQLMEDPNEQNFNLLRSNTEQIRISKLTGENCPDCGTEIYKDTYDQLDLHCYQYKLGNETFKTPDPFKSL